jgi:MraZ protein
MLIGEYRHTIDPKKRISIPANFRKEMGKKVVITRGLDNCLFVYPLSQWEKVSADIGSHSMNQSDARGFMRFMFGGAVESEVDAMGRILIPDYLKNFACLKNKVVLVGIKDRIEIWDERKWNEYSERVEKQAEVMAEKLVNGL